MPKPLTTNLAEHKALAQKIVKNLKGGEIFALLGNLGAGKTSFVKAVAKELKIKKRVTSPTFVLMNLYPLKLKGKTIYLYHLDLYRTQNFKEVESLGLTDFWGKNHTITFIEWADKIKKHLPKKTQVIKFLDEI